MPGGFFKGVARGVTGVADNVAQVRRRTFQAVKLKTERLRDDRRNEINESRWGRQDDSARRQQEQRRLGQERLTNRRLDATKAQEDERHRRMDKVRREVSRKKPNAKTLDTSNGSTTAPTPPQSNSSTTLKSTSRPHTQAVIGTASGESHKRTTRKLPTPPKPNPRALEASKITQKVDNRPSRASKTQNVVDPWKGAGTNTKPPQVRKQAAVPDKRPVKAIETDPKEIQRKADLAVLGNHLDGLELDLYGAVVAKVANPVLNRQGISDAQIKEMSVFIADEKALAPFDTVEAAVLGGIGRARLLRAGVTTETLQQVQDRISDQKLLAPHMDGDGMLDVHGAVMSGVGRSELIRSGVTLETLQAVQDRISDQKVLAPYLNENGALDIHAAAMGGVGLPTFTRHHITSTMLAKAKQAADAQIALEPYRLPDKRVDLVPALQSGDVTPAMLGSLDIDKKVIAKAQQTVKDLKAVAPFDTVEAAIVGGVGADVLKRLDVKPDVIKATTQRIADLAAIKPFQDDEGRVDIGKAIDAKINLASLRRLNLPTVKPESVSTLPVPPDTILEAHVVALKREFGLSQTAVLRSVAGGQSLNNAERLAQQRVNEYWQDFGERTAGLRSHYEVKLDWYPRAISSAKSNIINLQTQDRRGRFVRGNNLSPQQRAAAVTDWNKRITMLLGQQKDTRQSQSDFDKYVRALKPHIQETISDTMSAIPKIVGNLAGARVIRDRTRSTPDLLATIKASDDSVSQSIASGALSRQEAVSLGVDHHMVSAMANPGSATFVKARQALGETPHQIAAASSRLAPKVKIAQGSLAAVPLVETVKPIQPDAQAFQGVKDVVIAKTRLFEAGALENGGVNIPQAIAKGQRENLLKVGFTPEVIDKALADHQAIQRTHRQLQAEEVRRQSVSTQLAQRNAVQQVESPTRAPAESVGQPEPETFQRRALGFGVGEALGKTTEAIGDASNKVVQPLAKVYSAAVGLLAVNLFPSGFATDPKTAIARSDAVFKLRGAVLTGNLSVPEAAREAQHMLSQYPAYERIGAELAASIVAFSPLMAGRSGAATLTRSEANALARVRTFVADESGTLTLTRPSTVVSPRGVPSRMGKPDLFDPFNPKTWPKLTSKAIPQAPTGGTPAVTGNTQPLHKPLTQPLHKPLTTPLTKPGVKGGRLPQPLVTPLSKPLAGGVSAEQSLPVSAAVRLETIPLETALAGVGLTATVASPRAAVEAPVKEPETKPDVQPAPETEPDTFDPFDPKTWPKVEPEPDLAPFEPKPEPVVTPKPELPPDIVVRPQRAPAPETEVNPIPVPAFRPFVEDSPIEPELSPWLDPNVEPFIEPSESPEFEPFTPRPVITPTTPTQPARPVRPQPQPQPQPGVLPLPDLQPFIQPDPAPETLPLPQPQPETRPDLQPFIQPQPKPEPVTQPQPKIDPKLEPMPQPQPQSEVTPMPEPTPQPVPIPQPQPLRDVPLVPRRPLITQPTNSIPTPTAPTVPINTPPGRPRPPIPKAFDLPGDAEKHLRPGEFPRVVSWQQGAVNITVDIDKGTRSFGKAENTGKGVSPDDTFKIVRKDRSRPAPRTFDQGVVSMNVTQRGISFSRRRKKL